MAAASKHHAPACTLTTPLIPTPSPTSKPHAAPNKANASFRITGTLREPADNSSNSQRSTCLALRARDMIYREYARNPNLASTGLARVKVVCFVTLLQVLILKLVAAGLAGKQIRAGRGEERRRIGRLHARNWCRRR